VVWQAKSGKTAKPINQRVLNIGYLMITIKVAIGIFIEDLQLEGKGALVVGP
jgi:hypothetical protein